jgi:hypothetical protein
MPIWKLRLAWAGVTALVVITALAVAACGSGASAGSPTSAAAHNRGEAQAQAARLLSMIRLPPGAVRSPSDPQGDTRVLAEVTLRESDPNLVDAHAWWTTRQSPASVLAYVSAHLPVGAQAAGTEMGSTPRGFQAETFTLPPVPGVLSERMIAVAVVQLTGTTTAVRTDGEAIWLSPRPTWERIPGNVTSARFTASGEPTNGRSGPTSAPVMVTGHAAHQLVAFINSLGVVQPGVTGCPLELFDQVDLRFYNSAGSEVAHAVENPTGCPFVALTIGSRTGPNLSDDPSVTGKLEQLNVIKPCAGFVLVASVAPPIPWRSGSEETAFSFTNRSDAVCRVSGYPRTVLIDAHGQTIRTTPVHQSDESPPPTALQMYVPLDPGQSAEFWMYLTRCNAPQATRARIRLAGIARTFVVAIGSTKNAITRCPGRLEIGALQSGI